MVEEDTKLVVREIEKSLANRQDQVRRVSEFLKPYVDGAKESKAQAVQAQLATLEK